MIYKYLQPSPHLKTYIREYLLLHLAFDPSAPLPMKPYPAMPEQGIRFFTRGLPATKNFESGVADTVPSAHIFGQNIARQDQLLPPEMLMLEITFQPGALYKFLRMPLTEFVHKNMDAELVIGKEIRAVSEQLANVDSYDAMFPIVENWLWKKIQGLNYHFRDIDKMGQQMMDFPAHFDLDKAAHQTFLSPRQFERTFLKQMGVSPKFFARICRFYKAFETKEFNPQLNWRNIAWDAGYTDYQHLVKDFKQFSGGTPNSLVQENAQSPERWLGVQQRTK